MHIKLSIHSQTYEMNDFCCYNRKLCTIFSRYFLLLYCFCAIQVAQAQNAQTDSLKKLLAKSKADTQKVKVLNRLCRGYWRHSPDTARIISRQALELAHKLNFTLGIANANNAIGISYYFQGDYAQAIGYYKKALANHQKIKNKRGISRAYNNLGVLYSKKGDFSHSLEYYQKGLAIQEELKDERLMAKSYNNIGNIYLDILEYQKALDFHQKALAIKKKRKVSPASMMYTYTNIGNVYKGLRAYKKALQSYQKALKICLTENLLKDAALSYTLMGFVMSNFKNKLDSAIYYQQKSIAIAQKRKLRQIEVAATYRLSATYRQKKDLANTIKFGKRAVDLGLKTKVYPFVKSASWVVFQSYRQLKNYEQAFKYQSIYMQSNDSLFNEEKTKELTRLELNYNFDKKQALLKAEQKAKEDKLRIENDKKLQRERFYLLSTLGILFTVLVISIFALRSRQIQKRLNQQLTQQKDELQEQKQELTQLNEELRQNQEEIVTQRDYIESQNVNLSNQQTRIQSSIRAARTIQQAMLPFEHDLQRLFKDYFVIYQPKDIVSGDFYWVKQVGNEVIVVVADCTGHGVPGAFMSLIGINLLDKIVFQDGVTTPHLVLDQLHHQMNLVLHQDTNKQARGGMDAVILKLVPQTNEQVQVAFAGAKNSLYYFAPHTKEVQMVKGDRKSIGGVHSRIKQFSKQELVLPTGSILYAGSDGIQDQNNEARKKLGSQRLVNLLNKMAPQSLASQKTMMEQCIDEHMQGTTQRDDILWMAIQI